MLSFESTVTVMRKALKDLWLNQTALQELYRDCIDPVCKKYDLSEIEFKILLFIFKYPDLNRAADIVKCKGLSKSYVSLSVKNLTAKGLLIGRRTETDHKNIYLYVTPEAEAICNEGLKAQRKYLDILLGGFEKEEVDQFLVYFNRINKNVKNAHDEKLAAKKKKKTS